MKRGLELDQVRLVPQYSTCNHREDNDTSTRLGPYELDIPLVSSPMSSVTGVALADCLFRQGALGTLPRFLEDWERLHNATKALRAAVAVGVNDTGNFLFRLKESGVRLVVVDVAHAGLQKVLDTVEVASAFEFFVLAGAVDNAKVAERVLAAGAFGVTVGVGSGSVCRTRGACGVGVPSFTAIQEVSALAHERGSIVVADGGIRDTGVFCKAIAAGADACMSGRLFASCYEACGDTVITDQGLHRLYGGMSLNKPGLAPEGTTELVRVHRHAGEVLSQHAAALRSCMSYMGASTIEELHEQAEWVEV